MLLMKTLNHVRALEARLEYAKAVYDGDYYEAWRASCRECMYEGRPLPQATRPTELRKAGPRGWSRV
jgi:hypothetical protein